MNDSFLFVQSSLYMYLQIFYTILHLFFPLSRVGASFKGRQKQTMSGCRDGGSNSTRFLFVSTFYEPISLSGHRKGVFISIVFYFLSSNSFSSLSLPRSSAIQKFTMFKTRFQLKQQKQQKVVLN